MYNYIDGLGCKIWLNKYGDIIKVEDKDGRSFSSSQYGNGSIEDWMVSGDAVRIATLVSTRGHGRTVANYVLWGIDVAGATEDISGI